MVKCVSKHEGHREIIEGFQNFRKNIQTDRPTDIQSVAISDYEKLNSVYLSRTLIHFFQLFMDYTAAYRQQRTGHGMHQNSSTVDIDSISWRILSGD